MSAHYPILRLSAHETGYLAYCCSNQPPFATYFNKIEGGNSVAAPVWDQSGKLCGTIALTADVY